MASTTTPRRATTRRRRSSRGRGRSRSSRPTSAKVASFGVGLDFGAGGGEGGEGEAGVVDRRDARVGGGGHLQALRIGDLGNAGHARDGRLRADAETAPGAPRALRLAD